MTRGSDPFVRMERSGPVMVITLQRPERHNSLIPELLAQFVGSLSEVSRDEATRAVVLQASGRSFSTGGDVRGFWEARDRIAAYADEIVGLLNQAMLAMMRLPQPIVGAVHGPVTGGSLGLVLGCDIVLATPGATLTPWYRPVGFAPDGGWTAILPEIIGLDRVDDILANNRSITAAQAVAWGLVNDIVSAAAIRGESLMVAQRITNRTAASAGHLKARTPEQVVTVGERLEDERHAFVLQVTTDEAAAGMARYLGINTGP